MSRTGCRKPLPLCMTMDARMSVGDVLTPLSLAMCSLPPLHSPAADETGQSPVRGEVCVSVAVELRAERVGEVRGTRSHGTARRVGRVVEVLLARVVDLDDLAVRRRSAIVSRCMERR